MTGAELRQVAGPNTWAYETLSDEEAQELIDEEGLTGAIETVWVWEQQDSTDRANALRARLQEEADPIAQDIDNRACASRGYPVT